MRLEAGETIRRLEAAVTEARTFFGIDPLYVTPVRATLEANEAANIEAGDGYLYANINVSLDYYQRNPELIRQDMAHEVGHLLSNEILQLQKRMPEEWRDHQQAPALLMVDAIETLTVRLERLFMRERGNNKPAI